MGQIGGMMDRGPLEKLLPVGAAIASAGAALYLARKLLSKTEWVQVTSRSVIHGFLHRRTTGRPTIRWDFPGT